MYSRIKCIQKNQFEYTFFTHILYSYLSKRLLDCNLFDMNTEEKKHRKEAVYVSYLSGYPSIAR